MVRTNSACRVFDGAVGAVLKGLGFTFAICQGDLGCFAENALRGDDDDYY
jgi:hypothetical protein